VKTTSDIQNELTTQVSIADGKMSTSLGLMVSMADYSSSDGTSIVKKGDSFSEEMIPQLLEAGITTVTAAPSTPTEIACAQLCGLGHFRMRGFVTVQTEEEFRAWLEEQASYLTE
jgi:hypothetical protein